LLTASRERFDAFITAPFLCDEDHILVKIAVHSDATAPGQG